MARRTPAVAGVALTMLCGETSAGGYRYLVTRAGTDEILGAIEQDWTARRHDPPTESHPTDPSRCLGWRWRTWLGRWRVAKRTRREAVEKLLEVAGGAAYQPGGTIRGHGLMTQSSLFAPKRKLVRPNVAATFNDDRTRRFDLTHAWGWERALLPWVMLNPSIAGGGQTKDNLDPTLRRVRGFTKAAGAYDGFVVFNLYSLISTDPAGLAGEDPLDLTYDMMPMREAATYPLVVMAFGAHPKAAARLEAVWSVFAAAGTGVVALGTTKSGAPRHPLYMPKTATLQAWSP